MNRKPNAVVNGCEAPQIMRFFGFARPFIAAALSLYGLHAAAQSTSSLWMQGAYVMGALASVADVADMNVIVIGDPQQRLDARAIGSDPKALLMELAKTAGFVHREIEGVHVFSPEQCELRDAVSLPSISNNKISFHFQAISPSTLLAVLADFSDLRSFKDDASHRRHIHFVSVRLKHLPAPLIYRLLSEITGIRLVQLSDGSYHIGEQPNTICGSPFLPIATGASILERQNLGKSDTCVRREHDRKRGVHPLPPCTDLEFFPLEELVVRGRIVRHGSIIPLIEAPNGRTYPTKRGDYLGHHYGRIEAIEISGLTVREIKLDGMNIYREHLNRVDWNNKRNSFQVPSP